MRRRAANFFSSTTVTSLMSDNVAAIISTDELTFNCLGSPRGWLAFENHHLRGRIACRKMADLEAI